MEKYIVYDYLTAVPAFEIQLQRFSHMGAWEIEMEAHVIYTFYN